MAEERITVVDVTSEEVVVDALMRASRALVGVSTRSIEGSYSPVTLPQYRALLVISRGTSRNQAQVAAELGVVASSVTRMVERLESLGFVRRDRGVGAARGFQLEVTSAGQQVVDEATAVRRAAIARVVNRMDSTRFDDFVEALDAFSDAEGEPRPKSPGS